MQAKLTPYQEEVFEPLDLTITITSKEEAQALYAIFNHNDVAKLLGSTESRIIKQCLVDYYVDDAYKVISNGITYTQWYNYKW